MASEFDQYREQVEATIADLRARVSHYEARIAEQMEPDVSEDDLRAFIVDVVRRNDSLPQALRKAYRITRRLITPPADDRATDRTECSECGHTRRYHFDAGTCVGADDCICRRRPSAITLPPVPPTLSEQSIRAMEARDDD